MTVTDLSESSQNYLKAIWTLGEWSDERVTAKTVAERVGVRLSTASDAIRKLTEQGFVEHARYGAVTLTELGRMHAVAMVRRHRLIETFLVEALSYRWDQVHDEAESLEHAVSDFMIDRIDEYLGHPDRDPHGDPIPTADGKVTKLDAHTLTAIETGQRVQVERISDADPRLLQYFADHNIGQGTVLETHESAPFSETVEVSLQGKKGTLSLGKSASNAVWVRILS